MNVAVIGQGYVGLPLSVEIARAGNMVFGIDINKRLIEDIRRRSSAIGDVEKESLEEISNSYAITEDFNLLKSADIVLICVPTPLKKDGSPNYKILLAAVREVAKNFKSGALIIVESTVGPGAIRKKIKPILSRTNKRFGLAYSPERVDPSNKNWGVYNTPKIVAGLTDSSLKEAVNFYKTFIKNVIPVSSLEVAEMTKLLENSFRLINISFINEISQFCKKINVDPIEVIEAAATKPYGFMPFYPSLGIGGHCIPVDPVYLANEANLLSFPITSIENSIKINERQISLTLIEIRKRLGSLKNKKVMVVGISYKSNVSDIRESPAIKLIYKLREKGTKVLWHDELVKEWNGELSSPIEDNYDLAVIVNPHNDTKLSKISTKLVFDTRGKIK